MLDLVFVVVALSLLLPLALVPISVRVRVLTTRVALAAFGDYVSRPTARRSRQRARLKAAHVPTTHRVYAARTILYSVLAALSGTVVGVYAVGGLFELLAVRERTLRDYLPDAIDFLANFARLSELGLAELWGLLLFSGATVGATFAIGIYWTRWTYLDRRAAIRRRAIETTLPRTVGFLYALSRSGMPFHRVLETLTRNHAVYGAAAEEIGVAVRDMDAFGTDVLTALRGMADRTPSQQLDEFGENLTSILGSGRSLSTFLRDQYERYQNEAEAQQRQYLELLSTFAEIYVTLLVAGPLFLLTVLVVIGLVLRDTLPVVQLISYAGIPVASVAFAIYVDAMTKPLRPPDRESRADEANEVRQTATPSHSRAVTDGGLAAERADRANRERLAVVDLLKPLGRVASNPTGLLLERPSLTLVATVPIGLLWVASRVETGSLSPAVVGAIDRPVVEALLFVFGVYGLVYEVRKRRIRAIEDAVPDFLERMAGVNDAGLTIVESLRRVSQSDLGALDEEIRRTWLDVEWGADAATALRRLDRRTDATAVSRAVTLVTNAMRASGDIAPVLEIAAGEARMHRRLRRERRQEMLVYLLVIYISFLVFLGIIAALAASFLPAIAAASTPSATTVTTTAELFGGFAGADTDAYHVLFFHVAAIQGVCSGVLAGQLGEGDVRDGVKHAALLLLTAYLAFAFI